MKKIVASLCTFVLLLPASMSSAITISKNQINTSLVSKGIVAASYVAPQGKRVKVSLKKDSTVYFYDLPNNGTVNYFPMQLKNGQYDVSIYEQVSGNEYKAVQQASVNLQLKDSKQVYLQSIQNIKWDSSMPAIKKAGELTKKYSKTEDKVKAVHSYITSYVKYDYAKLKNLQSGYIPNVSTTFKTNKGICYDYSSLFAAMLRSQGIPTKLVTGYTTNVKEYHAWNEVYIKETGKWVIIDSTVDAAKKASKQKYTLYKPASQYKKSKEY